MKIFIGIRAKLKESEEKYRESINFANDAIFTFDMHGVSSHLSKQQLQDLVEFMKAL